MAQRDNPFAVLGDDDDDGDVSTLLARVEAKISPHADPQKPAVPVLKPEHVPVRGARGRGRGGRAGFGSDADEQYRGEQSFRGGGRGRAGSRDGRDRGRGRGFYEGRAFGNENQPYNTEIQAPAGGVFEEGAEGQGKGQGKDRGYSRPHPPRYVNGNGNGDGKFGDENRFSEWEERRYDGDRRVYRSGREGRGRGYGVESHGHRGGRGGYGGGNHGRFRGSEGHNVITYVPDIHGVEGEERGLEGWEDCGYTETQDGASEGLNQPEGKEECKEVVADVATAAGEEQVANTADKGDGSSGWDLPETAKVPKDAETEKTNPEKEKTEKELEAEEDAKKMTLGEYEKLLHEKRKALETFKTEERKVVVDKEFEGMQLVEKKKEEELFIKLKVEKDKLKKKDSLEKEEKARKLVSIDLFVMPAESKGYSRRGNGRGRGRGRGRDGYISRGRGDGYRVGPGIPAPYIEDPSQFPLLGELV